MLHRSSLRAENLTAFGEAMSSTRVFESFLGAATAFLALILATITSIVSGITILCMSNAWFSEGGVFQEIKKQDVTSVRIVHTDRNFFFKSQILVEKQDGGQQMYQLDSDITFDYRITAIK